jgi:Icc-related predicted phosphoesterase
VTLCLFASDLHGAAHRYEKLFQAIEGERPQAVFLGGDILPSPFSSFELSHPDHQNFIDGFMVPNLARLRGGLKEHYPRIFVILGNDDGRVEEGCVSDAAGRGIWEYVHGRMVRFERYGVYGYSYVPPTPFLLKDWERYDVSRYVDPGCVSPEEGIRSFPIPESEKKYATIRDDLDRMTEDRTLDDSIFLFHTPPYNSNLDRAALDGKMIDGVPLDIHVGSIAVRRFIEVRQPLLTLHGHIHESARLSGAWKEKIGRTHCFSAAHDGPELALVRFDPENLEAAARRLI